MSISIKKAGEACRVVCDVMAPRDGKASFQAAVDYEQRCKAAFDDGLQVPSRRLSERPFKILSINANRFSANAPKNIHQPIENLSDRQIKTALSTSEEWVPRGAYWKNPAAHNPYRIASAEPLLQEFTLRPYYYQGVAYGICNIKVTSSGEFVMPNVVRTVAMCTIINSPWTIPKNIDFNR